MVVFAIHLGGVYNVWHLVERSRLPPLDITRRAAAVESLANREAGYQLSLVQFLNL